MLIFVLLVIIVPSSVYYFYFNRPITTAPSQSTTSSSTGTGTGTGTGTATSTTSSGGPAAGFVVGGVACGFGLLYGSPGGEGCFIYMLNNGTATLTPTGTCTLIYGGQTQQGTFSYSDQMAPQASTGKVTCGSSSEDSPAGVGAVVSGQIFFTNGQYVDYNGTSAD